MPQARHQVLLVALAAAVLFPLLGVLSAFAFTSTATVLSLWWVLDLRSGFCDLGFKIRFGWFLKRGFGVLLLLHRGVPLRLCCCRSGGLQ